MSRDQVSQVPTAKSNFQIGKIRSHLPLTSFNNLNKRR